MRLSLYTLVLTLVCLTAQTSPALAISAVAFPTDARVTDPNVVNGFGADGATLATSPNQRKAAKLTRAERKELRRTIRKAARAAEPSTNTILLIILALFLAPLAMLLYEGAATTRFWISLLLFFLFILPSVIYTIYIIATGR